MPGNVHRRTPGPSLLRRSDPATPAVVVYTSDGADAHHSKGHEWPFVLVGGLQNTLRTDCVIEYPAYGRPGNRTINALYCTLLNAAGVECDQFNLTGKAETLDAKGPLAELLV